jgi:hypothetical protein
MKVKDTCSNNGSNGAKKTINFRGFGAMISRHTKSRSSLSTGSGKDTVAFLLFEKLSTLLGLSPNADLLCLAS